MTSRKLLNLILLFFTLSLILPACSNNDFEEVKGNGLTYSEFFKTYDGLDERKNVTYFKPVVLDETTSTLPDINKEAINILNTNNLPFEVDEKLAHFVKAEDKEGNITNQVQISYLNKSEYNQVKNFYIISITEAKENPLEKYTITETVDTVGNKLKKEVLTKDIPLYQQVITTDSSLLYRYYQYVEEENTIVTVGTTANEFYTYYNGYVYHVGYLINRELNNENMQENMLQLTRDFILGNTL